MGLFQDSDIAGDLEGSKSTSVKFLFIFKNRTFVPTSWMCKKQTSVSHSSIEAEVISLDAGLRMDGIPVLDLWDLVKEAWHSSRNIRASRNRSREEVNNQASRNRVRNEMQSTNTNTETKRDNNREVDEFSHVDHVVTNAKSSHFEAMPYIFEDDEAMIKMIIKDRSPTMRHVSRTHRVALDRIFDRIKLDPKIQIKYVDTQKPTCGHVDQR